ncbi:hypothetical protein ANCCAN_10731 [Ancylostoma caninum]|uniref:Uncharacterized protein n=1 Tax=Ancylostoma caninum TaxID=29170 RepID=A0A368GG04_ANCCA|nr:hypothetical protein ANCCAN_10731 [Ancylostoma caninum]
MRNWPLFAFLTGLVFFFYVFYVYQAQSTEFAMTRTELEDQIQKVRNLKMEVFNAKAENERLKTSETALKKEKEKFNKEKEECANSLRTCKLNSENLQTQAKKAEELSGVKEQQAKDLQAKIDALTKERDELAAKVLSQENLAKQLKAEVENDCPKSASTARVVAGGAGRRQRSLEVRNAFNRLVYVFNINDATETTPYCTAVEEGKEEKSDDGQLRQAPPPDHLPGFRIFTRKDIPFFAGETDVAGKADEGEKKDAPQVVAPPQQPGDRVKLAVAAEQDDDIDKPVVKGGDYDDKLDVEKGVGDDVQSVQ